MVFSDIIDVTRACPLALIRQWDVGVVLVGGMRQRVGFDARDLEGKTRLVNEGRERINASMHSCVFLEAASGSSETVVGVQIYHERHLHGSLTLPAGGVAHAKTVTLRA
jgi:hypothetical protein